LGDKIHHEVAPTPNRRWSESPPTANGWYWWRAASDRLADLGFVEWGDVLMRDGVHSVNRGGQWWGPVFRPGDAEYEAVIVCPDSDAGRQALHEHIQDGWEVVATWSESTIDTVGIVTEGRKINHIAMRRKL
jgi:hypothetical protein